ncbi:MAG: hydroxyacid dehydrogenase [Phycisphaerae bacterium]|nr:hydroxyacid dehydrogenase [Phycisphaerae bacterium]
MSRSEQSHEPTEILVVEAHEWERERLEAQCPHACEIITARERLEDLPDDRIPDALRVLSVFVHSSVTAEQLDRMPGLELITTRSTGFDHIDADACRRRGITICNVPNYGENTVAEHTFGMLLALTRKIHRCYERTTRGDFSIEGLRGEDLYGKTFGALGTGRIARHALRIAGGFGMRRLGYDIAPDENLAQAMGFSYVDFDALLGESDVLSLHVPYNEKTRHIVDADALAKMKPGAILVNTARGGLVDPEALIDALRSGHLGGAALDVLEAETAVAEEAELLSRSYDVDTLRSVVQNTALLRMENVIITPHNAFNSSEALERIIKATVGNVHAYLAGTPENVVAAP